MAGTGRYRFIAIVALAVSWMAALPTRAFDAVGRFVLLLPDFRVINFLADLTRGPALALDGPAGQPIDSASWHRNRHEAGLARLGTVRHR